MIKTVNFSEHVEYSAPEDIFLSVAFEELTEEGLKKLISNLDPEEVTELKDSIKSWKKTKPVSSDEMAVKKGSEIVGKIIGVRNFSRIDNVINKYNKNFSIKKSELLEINKALNNKVPFSFPNIDKDKVIERSNFSDWSSEVPTKWTPPEGLFENGTAQEIAEAEKKGHKDLKSAMASINFYLNRGGDNIPKDRRKVIEESKELLRGMYDK